MPFIGHGWIVVLLILVIVLIVFGAGRLGDLGGALGHSVREFRKETQKDESGSNHDVSKPTNPPR